MTTNAFSMIWLRKAQKTERYSHAKRETVYGIYEELEGTCYIPPVKIKMND